MKTLYLLLLMTLFSNSVITAQINNNLESDPFVGTWEYVDGNEIFKVEFYIDESITWGHFEKLIINPDGSETLTFKSNLDLAHGFTFGPVIWGGTISNMFIGGLEDNSITNDYGLGALSGSLKMEIISSNPTTATWKVSGPNGLRLHFDERVFSIPTDVVMTKVE